MTFMLIYESMNSLLVLYVYFGSYIIQNMVAKTGPKVAKTGTSTLYIAPSFIVLTDNKSTIIT